MKKTVLSIIVILCFGLTVSAQTKEVKLANVAYINGNYELAAQQYEDIIATVGVAPELYYNLGNTYYKLNEVGLAILNYERALRLDPKNSDAQFNLEMAQLKVVDNIVDTPTFFLGKWIDNFVKFLSSNQWFYLSITFFIVCLIFAFLFIFGPTRQFRKMSFYFAVAMIIASSFSVVFANVRKQHVENHNEAIITVGVVSVKSSPDKSGTDLFQLHEGTKVQVKSTLGSWTEIKLGNGNVGWLEADNISRI